MKISELSGKPVISLYEAEEHGVINCVLSDRKLRRVHYCTLIKDDLKYIMPAKDIYVVSDAVIVINDAGIAPLETVCLDPFINCPLGSDIYDSSGGFLGTLSDIKFSKNGLITSLVADGEEYLPSRVSKASESLVIFQGDVKPSVRKRRKIPASANDVEIIKNEYVDDYGFLIGRRALKNIYNLKRQLIIKQGQRVDAAVVAVAKKWHKLPELAIYSK